MGENGLVEEADHGFGDVEADGAEAGAFAAG